MLDAFKFEDGFITAKQLARRVTAYKEPALQTALENGCQSVPQVMAFMARRDAARTSAIRAGASRGARLTDALVKRAQGRAA